MGTIVQKDRLLVLETPLGKDILAIDELRGDEGVSQPFQFQLHLLSNKSDLSFDGVLGKKVTIHIRLRKSGERIINGFVSRFEQSDGDKTTNRYQMEVVPWVWFLKLKANCRIFQRKNVLDIVKDIFSKHPNKDFRVECKGTYEPREYCVQYRETDWSFVSRLLEEEGIFYFFDHSQNGHTMVLCDANSSFQACPNQSTVKYHHEQAVTAGEDTINGWGLCQEVRPGKVVLGDYYFMMPARNLTSQTPSSVKSGGNGHLEIFDYPGYFSQRFDGDDKAGKVQPEGDRLARVSMQSQEATHKLAKGGSDCRAFLPGKTFTLKDFHRSDMNMEYVLLKVHHTASNGIEGEFDYRNIFECIPKSVTYRPTRMTAKPSVQGPQTAIVVGRKGEEIYTDKYGRVKLQFHWDREGKKDENSSCWVRVAQVWAGKQWGFMAIPRIGQEVIVEFLEGDPDQPIVTGRVYNFDNKPPYDLPANQTQSGLKTRSSKQGNPKNFNELRFEDKKGEEEIYFHAEKDFKRFVENDDSLEVEHDQTITIKNHRTETLKEGDETVTIKKGKRAHTLETGDDSLTLKKGNRSVLLEMGNATLRIKMGNQTTKLDMGASKTEAMQAIELKVGQSSIKIDQMGITLKGMTIKVEGSLSTDIKGLMTNVKGSAMLQMGGGMTMIG